MKFRYSAIVGVVAACAIFGGVYRFHVVNARHAAETAKAEHEAALADSAQIARESKAYWDDKNRRARLRNDELGLQNAQLDYEIAGLEGRPRNRLQIEKDEALVANDKLTVDLVNDLDTGEPTLDPYHEDARIEEHNRKYPRDKMMGTSDITKQMEAFQERVNGVNEQRKK
jgi:hypothetical protein